MRKRQRPPENEQIELLRDILITQLAIAGAPQRQIRAIARCDMNRVAAIVRTLGVKANKTKRRARREKETDQTESAQ